MRFKPVSKRVNYRAVNPDLRSWLAELRKLAGVKVRPDYFGWSPRSGATGVITITNRMPTGFRVRVNLKEGYQIFYVFFVASQREAVEAFLQKPIR